jgi:alkylation response protein AidB-like acyl-CoA dehydrogenase
VSTQLSIPIAADTAPVTFGSTGLQDVIDRIAAGTEDREQGRLPARDAIDLVRATRLGVLRLPAPGGGGASLRQLYEVILRLGEADSNIPHILRNHFAFVERARRVPENPKFRHWLDLARAGKIFGLGGSELGTQNIGNGTYDTTLQPSGDGYVLNGRKFYSTGNYYSDLLYINAQTPDGRGVGAIIPVDRAGVSVADDWDGVGQRLTASGTTVLENVQVEPGEVVDIATEESKVPHSATFQQLYLTTIIAGILRAVVKDAVAQVKRRDRNYYHALAANPAEDPLLQQVIGRLSSIAYVAEASVLGAADVLGQAHESAIAGKPDPELFEEAALRTAKSKIALDELALSAASQLFDVGGASGATRRQRLDRHWRNIRTIASHNPVAYKARIIGQHLTLGEPLPTAAYF